MLTLEDTTAIRKNGKYILRTYFSFPSTKTSLPPLINPTTTTIEPFKAKQKEIRNTVELP